MDDKKLKNTEQQSEVKLERLVRWIKLQTSRMRIKTWAMRVFIMNLSWIPFWWLRKYIPKDEISWTIGATIRGLVKRIDFEKRHYESLMSSFRITEKEFAEYRKTHFAEITNEHQKKILKDSFGIDLST